MDLGFPNLWSPVRINPLWVAVWLAVSLSPRLILGRKTQCLASPKQNDGKRAIAESSINFDW
jgi:hypothetical protein